jgi:hypothetical protein
MFTLPGQPLPPDESKAVRKAKIMKWAIGFGVVFLVRLLAISSSAQVAATSFCALPSQSVLLAKKVFAKFSLGDSLGMSRPVAESAWNTAAFGAGVGAGVTNALAQRQLPYYTQSPGQFPVDPMTGAPYQPHIGLPVVDPSAPRTYPTALPTVSPPQLPEASLPVFSSAPVPAAPSLPPSTRQPTEDSVVSEATTAQKPQ